MPLTFAIGGLQSRDCDDARHSNGGQEVKSGMDEMEESPYCTTFDAITREIYNKKSKHMLDVILTL